MFVTNDAHPHLALREVLLTSVGSVGRLAVAVGLRGTSRAEVQ